MNRQKIIADFMEKMSHMRKTFIAAKGKDHSHEGLPTHAEVRFLIMIAQSHPQGIKDLAEKFCMTPSAATQFVNQLVKNAFVERKEDKADRRKIYIELTEKGKKIIKKAKKLHLASLTKMLAPLSDQELIQLKNIQQKIIKNLE
ncbi:MarR family transcriptional regulator [Candidatus Peregrinibacteria bacterium]|nr:MarR family transcriptional regulator [Candidatus Peregrinibacteria bacterium]